MVENPLAVNSLWTICFLGWGIALISTFLIDHFELFGLSQVWRCFRRRDRAEVRYQEHLFYRIVRHPLMLGFMIGLWATPHMTWGHLLFAGVYTVYILIAIQIEERDLVTAHGESYAEYQQRVPMILPVPKARRVAQ